MTFRPGVSGNPNGRPRKLLKRPDEILHEMGISPVQEILKMMPDLRPSDQLKAWLELMAYCHAKPKEFIETQDELKKLSTAELIELVRQKVPELGKAG